MPVYINTVRIIDNKDGQISYRDHDFARGDMRAIKWANPDIKVGDSVVCVNILKSKHTKSQYIRFFGHNTKSNNKYIRGKGTNSFFVEMGNGVETHADAQKLMKENRWKRPVADFVKHKKSGVFAMIIFKLMVRQGVKQELRNCGQKVSWQASRNLWKLHELQAVK